MVDTYIKPKQNIHKLFINKAPFNIDSVKMNKIKEGVTKITAVLKGNHQRITQAYLFVERHFTKEMAEKWSEQHGVSPIQYLLLGVKR